MICRTHVAPETQAQHTRKHHSVKGAICALHCSWRLTQARKHSSNTLASHAPLKFKSWLIAPRHPRLNPTRNTPARRFLTTSYKKTFGETGPLKQKQTKSFISQLSAQYIALEQGLVWTVQARPRPLNSSKPTGQNADKTKQALVKFTTVRSVGVSVGTLSLQFSQNHWVAEKWSFSAQCCDTIVRRLQTSSHPYYFLCPLTI